MTNWKTCKIIEKKFIESKNCNMFIVDEIMFYRNEECGCFINCVNSSPFDTYQVGDYLEIDIEKTINYDSGNHFDDINIVRKAGSSSEVVRSSSSNQQITSNQIQERDERMRRWVEESGGKYETDFIAREEYRTDGSVSAREMKWTYRKK